MKQGERGLIALIVILGTVLFLMIFSYKKYNIQKEELIAVDSSLIKETKLLFDLPADSFNIISNTVKRDQTLSDILLNYNISPMQIDQLAHKAEGVFDLRKFNYGREYFLFFEKDTSKGLRYFIYEHTPIDYIVFDFNDSLAVYQKHKEIRLEKKCAKGVITSSLWNTMVENNYNTAMAIRLSEIFAWTIDFFGIQSGDSFCVLYDEQYVDSVSIGIGKVYSAYFRHMGNDLYAIPFVQDSIEDYYDVDGNSLRKAFLKAPLTYSRISSRFSNSRMHPILKIRRPHHGIDYSAPSGTPVVSIGDGVIIAKGWDNGGGGNYVKVRHNGIYSTAYLHLRGFAQGIHTGSFVKQGDVIGYVGSTGLSTGAHLDFRFYKYGSAVDPLKVEAPPVDPIHEDNKVAFDSVKTIILNDLRSYNQ
jgi:murein DD-endopeptidase MepM/ murein hydrolase activator NlpD